MPIASPQQYADMLDRADAGGYALAAINVTSSQTLNGTLRGLVDARADGIVQVTVGAARYLAGPGGNAASGARALAEYAHAVAADVPVAVALHTDHATPADAASFLHPLIDESRRRRARGELPLFGSHMLDGSALPLAENLRVSREMLDALAPLGVVLEMEVGVVGGEEDGIRGPDAGRPELYTTADDLLEVAAALGTGEHGRYLVAATFGNVHGVHAGRPARLRPRILAEGQNALRVRDRRARFAYVFHGASGASEDDVRAAVGNGVVKVNLDTDAQYAFTRGMAGHVLSEYDGVLRLDGGPGRKASYDPRSWGRKAEAALAERVVTATRLLGSAGRSVLA